MNNWPKTATIQQVYLSTILLFKDGPYEYMIRRMTRPNPEVAIKAFATMLEQRTKTRFPGAAEVFRYPEHRLKITEALKRCNLP